MVTGLVVRPVRREDASVLSSLIDDLNRHEQDPVGAMTVDRVEDDLFGEVPWLQGLLAARHERPIGYALFHPTYETVYAARGFYVQDLFVVEEEGGRGVGRALLGALARIARKRGGAFLWWTSKPWNERAQAAYAAWGARGEAVHAHALTGEAFERMAEAAAQT